MTEFLNSIGKPVWITLMVIGFIWFWPVGLAILAYLVWSGRLGTYKNILISPFASKFWGSGNEAFDEHKQEILAQLEKEQSDFADFMENLRRAKDKSEFDSFMNSRAAK